MTRTRTWLLDHAELIVDITASLIAARVALLLMQDLPWWRKVLIAFTLGVLTAASEQPWSLLKARVRRLLRRRPRGVDAQTARAADQEDRTEPAHESATLRPESPELRPREPLPGWWCISSEAIMQALRAVQAGDDPGVVYAELYSNSEHEQPS